MAIAAHPPCPGRPSQEVKDVARDAAEDTVDDLFRELEPEYRRAKTVVCGASREETAGILLCCSVCAADPLMGRCRREFPTASAVPRVL